MRILKPLFFLLVFLIPFEIYQLNFGGIIDLRPYQIATIALLVIVGYGYAKGTISWKDLMRPARSPVSKILAIYFIVSLVSLANTPDLRRGLQETLVLLSFLVIYWLIVYFIRAKSDAINVLYLIVFSGLIASIVGLFQVLAYKNGYELIEVMPGRPNSVLPEPDWFGFFMVVALAALLSIRYLKPSGSKLLGLNLGFLSNYYFQLFSQVLFFMMIILTVARASWLAAVGIIGLYLFLLLIEKKTSLSLAFGQGVRMALVFFVSLAVIQVFGLTNFSLKDRFLSIVTMQEVHTVMVDPESGEEISIQKEKAQEYRKKGVIVKSKKFKDINIDRRLNAFSDNIDIVTKHPVLGIGFGGINAVFGDDINANNIFLEIMIATGVVGLMVFTPIFYYIFREWAAYYFKKRSPANLGFLLFIVLGLSAVVIPNVFNSGIFLGFFWLYLGIAASLLDYKLYGE